VIEVGWGVKNPGRGDVSTLSVTPVILVGGNQNTYLLKHFRLPVQQQSNDTPPKEHDSPVFASHYTLCDPLLLLGSWPPNPGMSVLPKSMNLKNL
jgi:hypothetical protein